MVRRVVVTGANGFIGNHVCRRLVESGKEITAVSGRTRMHPSSPRYPAL